MIFKSQIVQILVFLILAAVLVIGLSLKGMEDYKNAPYSRHYDIPAKEVYY